jgi:uncharacterized membrane protein
MPKLSFTVDKIAEKLAEWFGSTPFILLHIFGFGAWILLHHIKGFDKDWATLTIIVGIEVIFLSLFILRAENAQSRRFENDVRHELNTSKKILKEVHKSSKK